MKVLNSIDFALCSVFSHDTARNWFTLVAGILLICNSVKTV